MISSLIRAEIRRLMMGTNYSQSNLQDEFDEFSGFVTSFSSLQEPRFYAQAAKHLEWINAMKAEIQALESNKTWDITSLPEGKKAIGCRWVYKLKLKPDGTIDRYKARLVAISYNQVEGVDFIESFSPVAKAVKVRPMLAVAASEGWYIHQLNVNNAFLHGYLDEEIYMDTPEGYPVPLGHVCKLQKSFYGLKQASRQWNHEFTTKMELFGFKQSKNDYCLFTKLTSASFVALLVYVDDILIAGPSESHISEVKSYLDSLFTIKDLGTTKYFLGLEIARAPEGLALTQSKYIKDILQDMGLQTAKPTTTPLPAGIKFSAQADSALPHLAIYRQLIRRLLYLSFTRPDLSHATQQLMQILQTPCKQHWDAIVHLVRYLKGTPQKGLFFPSGTPLNLKAYCDANWASCMDTRRSLTGYCILGPALIS
ncbi:UNVERIFIED_CONTAM: putative mitochondrial protein [Sesamum calycinum]|uniref:Mitochondrial protein n=1 Tax=Sesamum calycinum TaxID=2727403 RepID=A0AAW2MP33_9LAMI